MLLESVECPLCGPDGGEPYFAARDLNLYGPGVFQLVRCRGCGLVYVSPRPGAADMRRYYPPDYWAAPPPEGATPFVETGVAWAIDILERRRPGGRVLDVGCGVGTLTAVMRDRGLLATGLEPSPEACRVARERFGLDVHCGVLQTAVFAPHSFDAVTFFDVLEHVPDPLGDLQTARRLLKPGGVVAIKAPNLASLQAQVLRRWWYWLDVPRHLFHFTPQSLTRALRAAGFASPCCRAIPDPLGAGVFETSLIYLLRDALLRRKGIDPATTPETPVGAALDGEVYAGVPVGGKRAFRWFLRTLAYAPFALEAGIGKSVSLVGIAVAPEGGNLRT